MDASLLDTDLLSELLKERNPSVTTNAAAYLAQHGHFTFSEFSRFEVRRGYLEMKGMETLTEFESFCTNSLVLPVSTAIFDRAAILWAEARAGGHPCGDADLVIAATALEHDLVLVTGNTRHFEWVPGLRIENWRTV